MDKERMWKLSSDKIVQIEMMKMVERCQFEHPCHSFILDTEDKNWLDFFTLEEINELKSHNVREMPKLPENFSDLLDSVHQSVMCDFIVRVSFLNYRYIIGRVWMGCINGCLQNISIQKTKMLAIEYKDPYLRALSCICLIS